MTPSCPTCGRELSSAGATCPSCTGTIAEPTPQRAAFTGPQRIASYRIVREIGHGGMGTVFEAHDEKMNRTVALKVLSRHHAPSEKSALRFEQEAWIAGRLHHPNLVQVYERGTHEELSYYAMELVSGGSLHDVIQNMKRWGRDDRLGMEFASREYVAWAIGMVVAAARALHYAHRHGVVHRDVKPMNLLLDGEMGTLKIADFGLAFDTNTTRMTTEGKLLGTLVYMAPEQILGKNSEIGPLTDVYALGVTLFELLTLELPYQGESQQLYMSAVLTTESRRPSRWNPRIGHDLEVVIRKALEKSPRDRFPDAEALAHDLESVLHFRPISAVPPSLPSRLSKWARRRPIHASLVGVLAVGGPVVAVLSWQAVQHAQLAQSLEIDQLSDSLRWTASSRRNDEALRISERILAGDPENVPTIRARAVIFRRMAMEAAGSERERLRSQALAELDRLSALAPAQAWPVTLRAVFLEEFGRSEDAAADRARAAALRSDVLEEDDLLNEAFLAQERGEMARAIELYSEYLARRPGSSRAYELRGQARVALGQFDRASEDFRLAVGLDPTDPYLRFQLWRILMGRGDETEAAEHLEVALARAPRPALFLENASDANANWARQTLARGDREGARRLYEIAERHARDALAHEPELAWAHVNLGASLMERNRLFPRSEPALVSEAIGHYERAISVWRNTTGGESSGAFAAALSNLCDAQIQSGDLARALEVCLETSQRTPDSAPAFYNLAGALALSGKKDAAFEALDRDFALGDRDWEYLASDPWFEALRADSRFEGLIERMRGSGSR